MSRDGEGFGGKSGDLIPGPVNIIEPIMSWALSCPEFTTLGAVRAPGALAPDFRQFFSKEEVGWGRKYT